ncbi:replication fork protection component Swi3-domain-containing protein [Geopyxis carbonaria]|nr:replication fork protection component Swi3-domain-containing protein [Geopyxis carbonaria]
MASTSRNAATDDNAMDDLFDYDVDYDNLDFSIPDPKTPPPRAPSPKKDILALDEEVQVKAKRVVVKLDEARLMGPNGLPKLRREAPKKLKFKGKGHEYKDAARLLSYYQLWADDMFKKGKFRDTLKIIEKLGHSKSMRATRKDWIYEDPNAPAPLREYGPEAGAKPWEAEYGRGVTGGFGVTTEGTAAPTVLAAAREPAADNDDDLYSVPARPAVQGSIFGSSAAAAAPVPDDPNALFKGSAPALEDSDDDMVDDAEIEALLAAQKIEEEKKRAAAAAAKAAEPPPDDFDDEMEAMGDMSFMD